MKTGKEALAAMHAQKFGLDWACAVEDVLEALAREKADAVPSPATPESVAYWKGRAEVAEGQWRDTNEANKRERDSYLRRAEAAEKERDALKANGHRAEREQSGLRARIKVLENHGWGLEAERDCARDSRDAREAACSLLKQDLDALRVDYERLSKLHEQDKAELVRWRKAAAELRAEMNTLDPGGFFVWSNGTRRFIGAILDRAEDKAAPLSTPPPDADEDLRARADTLERERNSALLERDEARKEVASYKDRSSTWVALSIVQRVEEERDRAKTEATEAKDALLRWGYAADDLRKMFPEHPNHEANSCVACMVRDRIARAENPPDIAF